MNWLKKLSLGLLGILIILILGFILFPKYWIKIVNPIDYKITKVDTSINDETIDLDFQIVLSNAYFIDYIIDSIRYDIYFDTIKFSDGSKVLSKAFKKGQKDTLNLPLKIYRDKLKSKVSSLQSGDSTELIIDFKNFVQLPISGNAIVPIKIKRVIKAPEPPEIKVISVQKELLELNDAIFKIEFSIYNPNNYTIEINEINGTISFTDLFDGKAKSLEPITISPQDSTRFMTSIDIDNLELVRDGLRVAFRPNKKWPYEIDVTFKIEQSDGSFMDVNLSHESEMEILGRKKNKEEDS